MPDVDSQNDSHELFVRLLAKHEPEIRAFIRASLPSPQDVAEVIQDASLIAWRKFSDLDDPENAFGRWMCVIARFEILKFRRGKARDRLVLDEDIVEKLAEEGLEECRSRESWIEALEGCLGKLSNQRRHLVLQAYRPEVSMRELAAEHGKRPDALYQMLRRIRTELGDCIEKRIAQTT